ncbi:MAG: hypothetical protein AAFV93_12830 [Chloroflexota bacterium]
MRKIILLLMAFFVVMPTMAQFSNTDDVEMTPFFVNALELQGLRPANWLVPQNTLGFFQRGPNDPTAIIMQSIETEKDQFVADLPTQLQLTNDLTFVEDIETDFFTWEVYQSGRAVSEDFELLVDIAITEDAESGRTVFIIMQTNPVFYDNLHENVFLVALDALSPLQFYTDEAETYSVPIPSSWEVSTIDESFGQLTNPTGDVVVFFDAIEGDDAIVASETFLAEVNEDFEMTFNSDLHTIVVLDDAERIGDLEAVTIIYWENGDNPNEFVLQTVARQYDGVVYLTAIVTSLPAIDANEATISAIDNGFNIIALEETEETTTEE